MAKLVTYRVLRRHDGDRMYEEGDIRIARDTDVKHLLPNVLEEIGPADEGAAETRTFAPEDVASVFSVPAEKAEPVPLNKAEPAAPANKADTGRKPKRK